MRPDESGATLKLRAEDADDLAVISACLQDALVAVRDLAFVPEDHTFLLVANRFRWERVLRSQHGESGYQRTLCGVTFSEVAAVSYLGFRRSEEDRILSLLAIRPAADGGRETIQFAFSGGAEIRLGVVRVFCIAADLGEPWPTQWQPRHDADERV
jgi:Protein of unknown function (DUF2948)